MQGYLSLFQFLAASAIAGALAKLADDYQDKRLNIAPGVALIAAILYGAILGILSAFTPLASLFLALAIANALAKKLDGIHLAGFGAFSAIIIFAGLSYFDPYIFSLFLVCGLFDELSLKRPKILAQFFENRLATPAAALFILIHSAEPIYLGAIISFDILYRLAGFAAPKIFGTKIAETKSPETIATESKSAETKITGKKSSELKTPGAKTQ
ncbi:MAG: hypothetical protein V1822_01090, partial [Candidatus Micrarchaeota archaeon]